MCQQHNPIRKGVVIEDAVVVTDDEMFDPIWDTRDVPNAASIVTFFPPQPQASTIESNYEAMPLPGSHSHTIVGALLKSTDRVIVVNSSADAAGIVNALSNATITVTADGGTRQLAELQVDEIMDLDDIRIEHDVLADGTTDEYKVHLPAGPVQQLTNPFVIAAQQTFNAQLRFEDAGAVPADTLRLNLKFIRKIPK